MTRTNSNNYGTPVSLKLFEPIPSAREGSATAPPLDLTLRVNVVRESTNETTEAQDFWNKLSSSNLHRLTLVPHLPDPEDEHPVAFCCCDVLLLLLGLRREYIPQSKRIQYSNLFCQTLKAVSANTHVRELHLKTDGYFENCVGFKMDAPAMTEFSRLLSTTTTLKKLHLENLDIHNEDSLAFDVWQCALKTNQSLQHVHVKPRWTQHAVMETFIRGLITHPQIKSFSFEASDGNVLDLYSKAVLGTVFGSEENRIEEFTIHCQFQSYSNSNSDFLSKLIRVVKKRKQISPVPLRIKHELFFVHSSQEVSLLQELSLLCDEWGSSSFRVDRLEVDVHPSAVLEQFLVNAATNSNDTAASDDGTRIACHEWSFNQNTRERDEKTLAQVFDRYKDQMQKLSFSLYPGSAALYCRLVAKTSCLKVLTISKTPLQELANNRLLRSCPTTLERLHVWEWGDAGANDISGFAHFLEHVVQDGPHLRELEVVVRSKKFVSTDMETIQRAIVSLTGLRSLSVSIFNKDEWFRFEDKLLKCLLEAIDKNTSLVSLKYTYSFGSTNVSKRNMTLINHVMLRNKVSLTLEGAPNGKLIPHLFYHWIRKNEVEHVFRTLSKNNEVILKAMTTNNNDSRQNNALGANLPSLFVGRMDENASTSLPG